MKIELFIKGFISFCERGPIDYALIGAFAMQAYGYVRATRDVDFVVARKNQSKIVTYLESIGFETIHCSDGYSNHLHPVDSLRVDFVYVDDETAGKIFGEAKVVPFFKNTTIPVAKAEHLLAMKLFAAKNAPERLLRELADIKELVKTAMLDKSAVRQLFEKYEFGDRYNEVFNDTQG